MRTVVGLAALVNFEVRAVSLLRAATGSPVALVEIVELCGRGLTVTLLSEDAAETLVSDTAAGTTGAVIGSSTVLTTGAAGAGALLVDGAADVWVGRVGGGLTTDLLVSAGTGGRWNELSDQLETSSP